MLPLMLCTDHCLLSGRWPPACLPCLPGWPSQALAHAHINIPPSTPPHTPPYTLPAGILAGAVSITASCALVQSYAAVILGAIGGAVYMAAARLLQK